MGKRTAEEAKKRLARLKAVNQIIAQRVQQNEYNIEEFGPDDPNVEVFEIDPKQFTNKELESFAYDTNNLIEYAEEYHKYHLEYVKLGSAGKGPLLSSEGNNLERLAPFAMDVSYVNYEEGSKEYNEIIEKNKQILEELKSPEKRKAFAEAKIRELLKADLKTLLTGTDEEKFKYCKENPGLVDMMFIVDDLWSYYKNLKVNDKMNIDDNLLSALTEKRALIQGAGGVGSIVEAYSSELAPMIMNMSRHDAGSLSAILNMDDYSMSKDSFYDGTQTPEQELFILCKQVIVGKQSADDLEANAEMYKILADNGLIASGEDNIKYEAFDMEGNKLTMTDAIKKLKARPGQDNVVKFRQRSEDEISHILTGKPEWVMKGKDKFITFIGKRNITALSDYIKAKTGKDAIRAIEDGFITFGKDSDRFGLFKPGENEIDTIEKIYDKLESGENLYISDASGDEKEYKVNFANGKFFDKEIVSEKQYNLAVRSIKALCDNINGTGKGFNDSKEFNEFKKSLNDAVKNGLSVSKVEYAQTLQQIHDKAFNYMFAKLDQSQNQRRATRFLEAAKTMEMIEALTEGRKPEMGKVHENIIAYKAAKSMLQTIVKNGDPLKHTIAQEALAKKDNFLTVVNNVKENSGFKSYIEKNKANLEALAKSKPKVHDQNVKKEEELVEQERVQRDLNI